MHKKYKLDKSSRHGIGLFAGEKIKKGELVYTASPLLDVNITQKQFDSLHENEKGEIRYWGFWDDINHFWHVDFDMSKFINHADDATLTQDEKYTDAYLITTKKIEEGEELTQNYREFESDEDLKQRGII